MPETFFLFLLGHIAGDFYLQSKSLSERKQVASKSVGLHGAIYSAAMLVVSIPLFFVNIWAGLAVFAALGLAHYVTDMIKFCIRSLHKNGDEDSFPVFITDQAVHIAAVIAASYILRCFIPDGGLTALFNSMGVSYLVTVKLICALALMGRPANIIFKKIFKAAKSEESAESGMKNAGAMIGTLERVISCVMFFLGQYAAIAIVLTAKSIARYNRLSTDPGFAEYYLTGTLSSIAYAILVSMLFFQTAL
jgi:hypothetical protein